MSEFEKRQDEGPGSRSGGHFVPPPPSSHGGGMYHHPASHHGHGHSHMSGGPHPTASFSPGTSHHHKMKHSMPPNGVPPVTPPHMPSQQHHLRQAPSSASSQYMSPQHYGPPPHGYHHNHGHHQQYHHPTAAGGHGPAPGTFMPPYSQHPIQHHEARGHHHRHGPHVSQSGSGSLGEAPPTPKTPKLDVIDEKGPKGGNGEVDAAAAPPSTFADFEPPRDDTASTGGGNGDKKRQSNSSDAAAKGSDSITAPSSPDTKKQRTLAPSASKDGVGAPTLSPTLTFASRCDSFRGAIAGTGVGLPTGMSFGMSGQDSQILQSWSAGSLIGRPNSPGDIQVCFDGWNPNSTSSTGGANGGSTRSPPGPQGISGRSWEEPIPLGSTSMMEFDKANTAGTSNSSSNNKDQPLKNQGSFGPPPPPLGQGFHRGMGMSGEFHPPGGHYGKAAPQQQQSYPGAPGWSPSFPSPHGHSMERRDEMGHLSSPRGGWAQNYAPPRTGSYGYPHHSPHGSAYPPMHGGPGGMDDSRRDPSAPYMMGPSHQHHHANFGGNGRFAIHSTAGQLRTPDGVLLLAMPDDRISLSETLCVVRENVEVFCATEADVKAPAPGRKRPVTVGQIGLRCIHCRNATNPGDRVKRAVCFPSSLKRIYRTVIDMKLDHFKACRYVPQDLKTKLAELKQTNGRSTGTTMQYFVGAAKKMGMIDGPNGNGVRYDPSLVMTGPPVPPPALIQQDSRSPGQPSRPPYRPRSNTNNTLALTDSHMSFDRQIGLSNSAGSASGYPPYPYHHHHMAVMHHGVGGAPMFLSGSGSSLSMGSFGAADIKKQSSDDYSVDSSAEFFTGQVALSMPEDKTSLSPLRCFLRENVIAFSATKEDIAVRTPTTFAVVEGQVGIGCVHCYKLPAKQRSNRAVCFPFSVARIYQSVADIQRFHLNECKMVPPEVREKFVAHQKASTKGSKGLATRQYWVSSAKKLGLADTKKGIRFIRDPGAPAEQPASLDVLAQVASDVNTASKPLVLPEDKPKIAEFLYVVMEQLQPCRFTEADRNKRRLKNMGSIGVECKHCAGKIDGRKFFWSSVNAVESNFVSVHTHMMECKFIPQELKDELAELKLLRKEQTSRLKVGSQKAFFNTVWERLHVNEEEQKKEAAAAIKSEETDEAQKPSAEEMTPIPSQPHHADAPVDHHAAALEMPNLNNSPIAPIASTKEEDLLGDAKNVCSI